MGTAMAEFRMRRRYLPSSPGDLVRDVAHVLATVPCTLRLLANHNNVSNTQRYGSHLCQLTYFKTGFQVYLDEDPRRVVRWKRRQVFVDYMPDHESFKRLPHDSVGYLYHRMCADHAEHGRPDLRTLRLQTLPEEAEGLDFTRLEALDAPDALLKWIVARRNIASSAGHDYRHLLTGSDTGVVGEALMGRYEYKHLREPGRWMNMANAVALLWITGRWHALEKVLRVFKTIDQSKDITEFDPDNFWDWPIADVRRQLSLPPEGLMPSGRLPD